MEDFDLVVPFEYNQGLILIIFLLLILWGFGRLEKIRAKKLQEQMDSELENIII